jgi:hypothetical protein
LRDSRGIAPHSASSFRLNISVVWLIDSDYAHPGRPDLPQSPPFKKDPLKDQKH